MERVSKLKVVRVVRETPNAISIHFKQPFFWKLKYTAGQYLTVLIQVEGEVKRRCFSILSAPNLEEEISITAMSSEDGEVSAHLFDTVKEGDKLKVLHPQGEFTIEPDESAKRHLLLFGGGSGIAPLMSILKTVLFVESKSMVSLFYGNRDEESILFNEELKDLQFDYPERLNLIHILENPGDFKDCYKGRVERTQIPELLRKVPKFPFGHTFCYISGPTGLMIEAAAGLRMAGVPDTHIFMEQYLSQSSVQEAKAAAALIQNREVKLIYQDKEYHVPVQAGRSILDAAIDAGVELPYVCKDGICSSCKAQRVSGEVFMRGETILSDEEIAQGVVLPCICKPLSNHVVLRIPSEL
ncbi:hypothetical protein BFP72_10555 [Reichenbachiella sp. 5M10]|uniref:ferredoxin--NADP reductase n=1 Tax=Reichenbachiella sp. 5M10 TaxID=1889772 RepID=UPI000C1451A1|nr:ferredoxin--NADP reductase [Reichenbachiella sp. 5M10]PIB35802.1 hypothetical protein BFP72_10555 [Reichenbachiella sp. 5M10]